MLISRAALRQIIIHTVTIEIPPSLPHVIRPNLHIIFIRIHITEVPEPFGVKVLEALAARVIRMPVPDIAPKGEEDDIAPDPPIYPYQQ